MKAGRTQRNERLAAVMAEAGFSNHGLARRVRELADRDAIKSSADHVSVSRWLNGANPRGNTPRYVSEALEAKLGRPIPLNEIGFTVADTAESLTEVTGRETQYPSDVGTSVNILAVLSKADLVGDHPQTT